MTLLATFKHISSKNADYGAAEAYPDFKYAMSSAQQYAWLQPDRQTGREGPHARRRETPGATRRRLIEVPMVGTTIPHEVTSVFGGARVLLKPAVEGAGVAAGGAVRAVVELAGIADVTSKSLGSNTPINIVRATVEGLKQLKRAEEVAALRGISVSDLA